MNVEIRPIKGIGLAKYNPRKISDQALDSLVQSIERFGFVDPVIVNDRTGILVGGHQRIKAAKKLGLKDVPVVAVNLDEAEEKALNVALNKISGEWDLDLLRGVLEDVQAAGLDLSLTGFTDDEWAAMGGTPSPMQGLTDPDEVPEVPEETETITKAGDLWILGDHRLLCGDSTKAEDVARLMAGAKADACVTDPPFAIMGSSTGAKNDPSLIRPFFRMFWNAIKSTGAFDVYMFCDWRSFPTIHQEADGWDIKDVIVWDKKSGGLGNPYRRRHEFIVFARPAISDKKMMGRTVGGCSITDDDVWQCERVSKKDHNAQKPLPIVARCIENSTSASGTVFEPCGGSGTTLIAAEQLGRKCYGMEISPQYCDVIVKRWEQLTGKKAVLDAR